MEPVGIPPANGSESSVISEQALFNRITSRIRESLELPEILSATVAEVRSYLGTDRVKIYQFYPDGHGLVIAEAINAQNLPSLKGLHFPADDIPPYARELYVSARQRTVVDVTQKMIGISKLDCSLTGAALPSSEMNYRSIDPCHVEYLYAMGVKSSVVVPIVLEKAESTGQDAPTHRELDQLWGLLVSHHAEPRTVSSNELDFIQSVVDQVSIAISQSVLLKKVREQARREADVNRVTALLYTSATVQLQRALEETVEIYQGSGGRICLFAVDGQSKQQLYTCGDQPTVLPGDGDRPIEAHMLWSNFLASTLHQAGQNSDREQAPWSVSWMKTHYAQDMPPDSNLADSSVWAVPDIYREPLFRSLTPRFDGTKIRGVIICPLHYSSSLMGCLTIFRDEVDQELVWAGYHSPDERQMTPRQSFEAWQQTIKGAAQEWTVAEIRLIHSLAERFAVAVKQFQLNQQIQALNANLERQVEIRTRELYHSTTMANQQRTLAGILAKLQKPLDMRTLFRTATHEMQQLLNVDRVAVYRFDEDWGGEFVSEFGAVSPGWAKIILATRSVWNDSYLQSTRGGRYRDHEISVVHDIHAAGLSACHIEVLEYYYIRAFVIAPLFVGQKLWGLLGAYQHENPRQWDDSEATFVSQLATHLGVALKQAESIERVQTQAKALALIAEQQKALNTVITKIRESLDLDKIFKTTTFEVRRLLNADRVVVFQFRPGSNHLYGEVISEDIRYGFSSALDVPVNDDCFVKRCKVGSMHRTIFAVDDVEKADLVPCYKEMLQSFQIQANLVAPLFKGEELWGLLCIHQCSEPRIWEPREKEFTTQIATQLGVALQQAKLLIEAEEAREIADAANHAKSKFLANMSHELRTPLNAILGLAQLMGRDPMMTVNQQQRLNIIGQSGEHLLLLINDVLEMSKIEAGQAKLNLTAIHLPAFLNSLEDMLETVALSKGLALKFEIAEALPEYVLADEGKLRQVLINLLGNALKFTQAGEVTFTAHATFCDDEPETTAFYKIHFTVKDTGPGIAEEDLHRIFEAFAQASTGLRSSEGNGLGLAICRQFVALMGGDISVTSTVGQGSTFRFFIHSEPASQPDIQQITSPKLVTGLAAGQRVPKILVAEDKPVNRSLLVDFLESVGFEVFTATNGQEAIAAWQEGSPDLIWMDMRMPVMDGHIAAQEIKRLAGQKPPIIVALTANAFEEDRQIALKHGCDDFVRKPYQEQQLLDTMAKHLGVRYSGIEKCDLPKPPSLSVLIAEDNAQNRMTLSDMLSYLGHEVTAACNGQEAISALEKGRFDVILLDVHMPQMDGLEATRQIRRTCPQPQPLIVAATGSSSAEEIDSCLAAGMDTTIIKPFSLESLQTLLASLPILRAKASSESPITSTPPVIDESLQDTSLVPADLDRQYFEDYFEMYGDQAFTILADKLQKFIESLPSHIDSLESALTESAHEQIFQEAHRLKTAVAYVGGTDLNTVCSTLEDESRTQSDAQYPVLLSQLRTEARRLQLALELEIKNYTNQVGTNQVNTKQIDLTAVELTQATVSENSQNPEKATAV